MQIMNFSEANCRHCYKCVRTCKVKAIKIIDDQAHILPEKCLACGICFASCAQNARNIHSDLDLVYNALKNGEKIVTPPAESLTDKENEKLSILQYMFKIFTVFFTFSKQFLFSFPYR